jgi:hypothetical protein
MKQYSGWIKFLVEIEKSISSEIKLYGYFSKTTEEKGINLVSPESVPAPREAEPVLAARRLRLP